MWLSLLAVLALQVSLAADNAYGSAETVAVVQGTPATKAPGPATQAGTASRGQSPNRPPNGQRPGPPNLIDDLRFYWWRDPDVKRELGLSEETAKALNTIYQQREKEFFAVAQKWREESRTLEKMTREGTADINTYRQQVRVVDTLRSMLDTSRTVMIYSMFRQLRPDQFEKLKQIAERRRERDRDRSSSPGTGTVNR
jgi:hypothetical protein